MPASLHAAGTSCMCLMGCFFIGIWHMERRICKSCERRHYQKICSLCLLARVSFHLLNKLNEIIQIVFGSTNALTHQRWTSPFCGDAGRCWCLPASAHKKAMCLCVLVCNEPNSCMPTSSLADKHTQSPPHIWLTASISRGIGGQDERVESPWSQSSSRPQNQFGHTSYEPPQPFLVPSAFRAKVSSLLKQSQPT